MLERTLNSALSPNEEILNDGDKISKKVKYVDLIGKRVGYLLVAGFIRGKGYFCICSCGNQKIARGWELANGIIKSCGCESYTLMIESKLIRKANHARSPKQKYWGYKSSAKNRNREFELSLEQFTEIINKPCKYCGFSPEQPFTNGIDRINNDLGYTLLNSVPCCEICNHAKSINPLHKWFNWLRDLYEHSKLNRLKMKGFEPVADENKVATKPHLVLSCVCGDCTHWEIIREINTTDLYLLCKSCESTFHSDTIDHMPNLKWEQRDAI